MSSEARHFGIKRVITPANNYINSVIPEKLVLDLIGERESR
jgi:hypothetical protein